MKKLLLVLLLGFSIGLSINATIAEPPCPKLKVCTLQNTYYIDGLYVYSADGNESIVFKDQKELYSYISKKTREDNRPGYECLTKKNNYQSDY